MMTGARRLAWTGGGLIAVALGAAGIVLPLLPTTPFLLLAAFCFARSSQRLHDWLLAQRHFGPLILAWRRERAIPRRARRAAYIAMAGLFALSFAAGAPAHVLAIQAFALGASALFIASRPIPRAPEPAAPAQRHVSGA